MDEEKLQVIKELMADLMGDMEPDGDEFDSRLGKPKVDMMAIKAGGDMDGAGGSAMDGDDDDMDPEEKLRQRIMGLKG